MITFIIALIIWIIIVAALLSMWICSRKSSIAGKPILHQTAWLSLFSHFFALGMLAVVFILLVKPFWLALYLTGISCLVIHFVLERYIPHNHRKGISLCKQGNYMLAIEEFKKSYNFFCKHSWIDKYRFLALLSSSKVSYTEMALLNIAFCYVQLNDIKLAQEYYHKTLKCFPNNETAKCALNTMGLTDFDRYDTE